MAKFPKHTGGGWFQLSNGEKVQGKDAAVAAEAGLQGGPARSGGGLRTLAPVGIDEYDPLVAVAQAAIVHCHGLTTAVDGRFRRDTEAKVREIQQRAGLDVTGEVDQATWDVLLLVE
jgi:peptidoglycan hydrolase-like protein with peptidoglycan-binding domain